MIDGIVVMGKFEIMKFGWELKSPRLLARVLGIGIIGFSIGTLTFL